MRVFVHLNCAGAGSVGMENSSTCARPWILHQGMFEQHVTHSAESPAFCLSAPTDSRGIITFIHAIQELGEVFVFAVKLMLLPGLTIFTAENNKFPLLPSHGPEMRDLHDDRARKQKAT